MSEYIVELDSKHSIALKLAFAEEMRGGDFVRGEIVRCRDCTNYVIVEDDYDADISTYGCRLLEWKNIPIEREDVEPQDPDGFCAWGKRRGVAE